MSTPENGPQNLVRIFADGTQVNPPDGKVTMHHWAGFDKTGKEPTFWGTKEKVINPRRNGAQETSVKSK